MSRARRHLHSLLLTLTALPLAWTTITTPKYRGHRHTL